MSTAMCGVALLAAGRTEPAVLAGDCLLRMVEMQPAVERFFTTHDEAGRLQVAFPPEYSLVWRVVGGGVAGVGLPWACRSLSPCCCTRPQASRGSEHLAQRAVFVPVASAWNRGTAPPAGRQDGAAGAAGPHHRVDV